MRGSGCRRSCSKPAGWPTRRPSSAPSSRDPVLVYHVVVSEIIVAADARHAMSQLRSEPLGRRQIEIADRIVVTKIDEAEPADVARLLATLARLNPGARSAAR